MKCKHWSEATGELKRQPRPENTGFLGRGDKQKCEPILPQLFPLGTEFCLGAGTVTSTEELREFKGRGEEMDSAGFLYQLSPQF